MVDRSVLLDQLKQLSDSQWKELLFRLHIDETHLSVKATKSERNIELILLFEQQKAGLQTLQKALCNFTAFFWLGGNPNDTNTFLPLQTLLQLLQQVDDLTIVQSAYRQALPADALLFRSEATDITEIVQHLQSVRKLSDFIQGLMQEEQIPQTIRHSLKDVWQQFNQVEGWVQPASSPVIPGQISQFYLQISLRRDQCSDQLVMNGWLVPQNRAPGVDKDFQSLDLDSQRNGKPCRLEEVPEIVDQYLEKSQTILLGKRYELTIEIFLPLDHLCEAVDRWKITDSDLEDDELVPLGTRYQVLVRTYDRVTPRYLMKRQNDWRNNWDRVKAMWDKTPNPHDFEPLHDYCGCNWKRVAHNLSTQKLGLKLTCGLAADHQEAMLRTLHNSATPIAIWARCHLSHLDQGSEIDDLIASTSLAGLSAAIKQKRVEADLEDAPTMHLGTHLALLWEDPDRLTPDAQAQLVSPGE